MKRKVIECDTPKMNVKNRKTIIVISYVVIFLTGCILNDITTGMDSSRPKLWPVANYDEAMICPDISGVYKNIAEYLRKSDRGEQEDNLWYRLTGIKGKDYHDKKIKIHPIIENQIVVDILVGETVIRSKTLAQKAGDFDCDGGRIWLRKRIYSAIEGTGGYRNEAKFGIERANDGSLIGEDHLTGTGALLWVIPVLGTQSTWFRWMPDAKYPTR